MSDNHQEFARQVLRAAAHLYKHHPRVGTLSSDVVLHPGGASGREGIEAACGTVMWLYRNGLVTGFVEDSSRPWLREAQLAARSYMILSRKHGDCPDPTLGAAAIRAASMPETRDEQVIADIVLRALAT